MLFRSGYHFDGIVGTSIGAFNAAVLCQGDFQRAYDLWTDIEPSVLFHVDDEYMDHLVHNQLNKDTLWYLTGKAKQSILNKGVETDKLRAILDEYVDEEKVRASEIDFGLVTGTIPDFKAIEVFKEDIPEGKLHDYIMASANFPGFKMHNIDGKYYIDGGMHNNCPISMLVNKGYDQVVAVRTSAAIDKSCKKFERSVELMQIIPSEELGNIFIFNNQLIRKNMTMGYYDATRALDQLKGRMYYVEPGSEDTFFKLFEQISDEVIFEIADKLRLPVLQPKRLLFELIIPTLARLLRFHDEATYQDIMIGIVEVVAQNKGVDRFRVYDFCELLQAIEETSPSEDKETRKRRHLLELKSVAVGLLGGNRLEELARVIVDGIDLEKVQRSEERRVGKEC